MAAGLTTITVADKSGNPLTMLVSDDGTGRLSPVHLLDANQLATLVGAIGAVKPSAPAPVDCSGSIAAGGVAQNIVQPGQAPNYLRLTNPSAATTSLWFCDAVDGANHALAADLTGNGVSQELLPGQTFTWPNGCANAVSVISSDTGHVFTARKA